MVVTMNMSSQANRLLADLDAAPDVNIETSVARIRELTAADAMMLASLLTARENPIARKIAARTLGELGLPQGYDLLDESVAMLKQMAINETDSDVLSDIIGALGSRGSPDASSPMLSATNSSDPSVRIAAAANLPFIVDESNANEIEDALVRLSVDECDEVRDWAVAGLGSQLLFSPMSEFFHDSGRSRSALIDRLIDLDSSVRGEALVGLARRQDPITLGALNAELSGYAVATSTVKAAELLSDPRLIPQLIKLSSWWTDDTELLNAAIDACNSG